MNHLGFKNTLIIVVTGLLIIALGITSYLSITQLQDTTKSSLIASITHSSKYEASNIRSYINKHAQAATNLADLYAKNNYQDNHEVYMEMGKSVSGVQKMTLGFDDGRSYTSRPSESFPGGVGIPSKYDPRTRSWYKLGKRNTSLTLSDVFATKEGALLLLAVHPVEGGVLASDVRLSHLQNFVEGVDVAQGAVALIVDYKGMVLASTSDVAPMSDNVHNIADLSDFSNEMFSQESMIKEISLDGIDSLMVATRVELDGSKPWYLMVAVSDEVAFASVNEASWKMISTVLIIMFFFVIILIIVLNRIYRPVIELKNIVANLSSGDGDLTQRLNVSTNDDLGQIATSVNSFIKSLQLMMLDVQHVSTRLSEGVDVLKTHSDQSATILDKHQQETDQVVTAVEELSVTAELVAENAKDTAMFTQEANNSGETSKETIINAQQSLQRLSQEVEGATINVANMSQETQDIGSILNVIGGIADQTNLLALNAAIEAARAGEQGRGFAVVADEVRALAGRTQASTGEIEQALEKLQHESVSVVGSIETTRNTSQQTVSEAAAVADSLETMTGFVEKINDLSNQIASSAQEQNAVIREISQNMSRIHTMVQELNSTGASVNQETHQIHDMNNQLSEIVKRFRLE